MWLISCTFTAQLICGFVFAYAKSRFSHDAAHFISVFVFCRSLLEELKSLNLVIPEVEIEDGKEMETASTSHSIRGVLTDR